MKRAIAWFAENSVAANLLMILILVFLILLILLIPNLKSLFQDRL